MVFIYKKVIEKYINLLSPTHIKNYADSLNISINEEEVDILHTFIIENYKNLLENEETIYLLKGLVRDELYNDIIKLYFESKAKYL